MLARVNAERKRGVSGKKNSEFVRVIGRILAVNDA